MMFQQQVKIQPFSGSFLNVGVSALFTALMLILLATSAAIAASFDCTKAKTKQEIIQ